MSDLANYLIDNNKCDINVLDEKGNSAFTYACNNNMYKIVKKMIPQLFNQRDYAVSTVDKLFDEVFKKHFPELHKETGLLFSQGSYPKVNVIDFDEREQVLEYIGKMEPDNLADIAYKWGILYDAFIVVDITGGMGIATTSTPSLTTNQ